MAHWIKALSTKPMALLQVLEYTWGKGRTSSDQFSLDRITHVGI